MAWRVARSRFGGQMRAVLSIEVLAHVSGGGDVLVAGRRIDVVHGRWVLIQHEAFVRMRELAPVGGVVEFTFCRGWLRLFGHSQGVGLELATVSVKPLERLAVEVRGAF